MAGPVPGTIHCDVGALPPDAVTIDALARLHLAARRRGRLLLLENPSGELLELIALVGLVDVLRVQARR